LICLVFIGPAWGEEARDEKSRRAAELSEAGWKLIRTGDYHRAAKTFTEASVLIPKDAALFVGLGVSRHLQVKDDLAETALKRALTLNPGLPAAHKYLGDIYDQKGETETAVRHYETAFKLDPNDVSVKDRLLSARRAVLAEAGLNRLFSQHFVVKFHRSTGRGIANLVADRLEAVYQSVGKQFSYFPSTRVVVVLYPAEQFQRAADGPAWARGLFDGRIHLPVETVVAEDQAATLRHEYTHVVVHRLSSGQAPTWLNEGLALYAERGADASGTWAREVQQLRSGERPPLAALHRNFVELPVREASLAYAESYEATRVLIDRHGFAQVRRLLQTLSVMPDFAEAFEMVMRERYSEFDATWATTLIQN
jgi:tetratricopeptide (TPR) repeat protein